MQKRIIGFVVCLAVLFSAFPLFSVVGAEEQGFNSIYEIMGCEVESVSGLDFQFANHFDASMNYVTTPQGASYGANGLDLTAVTAAAAQASWRYKPKNGWAPFEEGDAIYFRAKVNAGGCLNFQFFHPGANNEMYRFYMNIYDNNFTVSNNVGSPAGDFKHVPGTDWADYFIKKNIDNGFSVYVKAATTQDKWLHFLTVPGDSWKSSGGNGIGLAFIGAYSGSDNTGGYVKELAVLKKSLMDFTQGDAIYREDFDVAPQYTNCSITSGSVADGELVLSGSNVPAEFSLSVDEIPANGSVVFCMKSDASTVVSLNDGGTQFIFSPNDYADVSAEEKVVWKIGKKGAGTFSGYYRSAENDIWNTAFVSVSGTASSNENKITFSVQGHLWLDYLEIQTPEELENVIVTDGAAGEILKSGVLPKYPESVCVLVKPDAERDRTLLTGIYGDNNVLADMIVKEIPAGTDATMVVCNTTNRIKNVRKIKTFLWDGFDNVAPIIPFVTTSGNASAWTDEWSFSGEAYPNYDALVLKSTEGKESSAYLETEIGDQYDISWDMIIDKFDGAETVAVDNGVCNVTLRVKEDGVAVQTKSGEEIFPWVIQSAKHRYRLIGDGTVHLLYIDGYFVGAISNVAQSSGAENISFSNQGESLMRIYGVFFGTYSKNNIPSQGFCDDFEKDACGWTLENPKFNNGVIGDFWKIEDGSLKGADEHIALDYTTYCVSYGSKSITEVGDEFLIQTRIAFPSFGTRSYLMIYLDGRCVCVDMREKFFSLKPIANNSNVATKSSDELSLNDSQYHILTIESYNHKKNVRLYLDGKLILEGETEEYKTSFSGVRFMLDGGFFLPASVNVDYIKYAPKSYGLTIKSPVNGKTFSKGETITISASEKADFILNGVNIASGVDTTLTGLPAGVYQLEAISGEKVSETVYFTISDTISATLQANLNNSNGSFGLENMTGFEAVESVVYLMDGRKVAESNVAPYGASVTSMTAENHRVEAVCYDKAGIEVARFGKEFSVSLTETINAYSYDTSYTASGTGTVDIKNGNHQLQMNHKVTGIRYLTDQGIKSYSDSSGVGEFSVLTDGPVAEVYKNGQFLLSFYMPKTTEIASVVSGKVENHVITIPQERKNYFSARNLNVENTAYELYDLDHNHNLDFVANASDEAHIALNDGYFRNDVTLQNGEIYVWTVERNNSDPALTKVAELTNDDVYYRVETSGGMSRMYADGRWIATFRNANVSGRKGALGVHVLKGDGLSYLAVNSNADLYYYRDTFDGNGEADSIDFWTVIDGDVQVDSGSKSLKFSTENQNAIAEINSYVGNAVLSADVVVNDKTEGVWFTANHCVSKAYTKIGYNFKSNSYEVVTVDGETEAVVAKKDGAFPLGTSVNVSLKCQETSEGKKVALFVDGQEMISSDKVINSRGTIGFAIAKGSISIDNVNFRGDAKPMLDVRTTVIKDAPNALDMIETKEKTYLVTQSQTGYYTTNGGKSWEPFTPEANAGFGPDGYGGMSKNMVQLKSGEIIAMHRNSPETWTDLYGQRKSNYQAYVSTDGGKGMTWYKPGNANFPDNGSEAGAVVGRDSTVNRITQGPSGRVYFVYGEGNSEDYGDAVVWMSDDDGKNWFTSKNKASALETGFVIAEAVVIETTKSTRMYFRTDKGQLCYFVSSDRGMTWDLTPHTTPMISSMTCFGLEADPEDPNTLYVAWGYDNINFFARAQFPRTRWAVAKSTDGGDSWEMIGTAHENTNVLTQGMNRSLNVGKDYIYLNGATADDYGSQSDGYNRIIAFPKDKQKSSLRMEQLHLRNLGDIENAEMISDEQSELFMSVNFVDRSVVIGDCRIENAIDGEYLLLDVAGSFVGATATRVNVDGSVTFFVGGQEVTKRGCETKMILGKHYIKLSSFVDKMGLNMLDFNGLKVITTERNWSRRQINSVRYSADLFTNIP